jgi:hypothetical protein
VSSGHDPEQDVQLELLGLLAEELVAGDVPASTLAGDGVVPAQLVVPLAGDTVDATVHVCFLPGLDNPPVLQYLVAVASELDAAAVPTTARFLQMLNSTLPLPGFEMSETAEAVVFRHVQAIAVQPLDPAVVAWPLSMIYHAVTRFEPLVRTAAAGASYRDLVAGFGRAQAELFASDEPED